jgi:hypothetical protein
MEITDFVKLFGGRLGELDQGRHFVLGRSVELVGIRYSKIVIRFTIHDLAQASLRVRLTGQRPNPAQREGAVVSTRGYVGTRK